MFKAINSWIKDIKRRRNFVTALEKYTEKTMIKVEGKEGRGMGDMGVRLR